MPDKGAAKAYGLLLNAMQESGKRRDRARRAALQGAAGRDPPDRDGTVLMMETMIFADEVVPPDDLDGLPDAEELKVSDRELQMAQQLIESLSADFEPEKYKDEYREQVLELIERKAAGRGDRRRSPRRRRPAKVPDLMAALEASLAAVAHGRRRQAQAQGVLASKAKEAVELTCSGASTNSSRSVMRVSSKTR